MRLPLDRHSSVQLKRGNATAPIWAWLHRTPDIIAKFNLGVPKDNLDDQLIWRARMRKLRIGL